MEHTVSDTYKTSLSAFVCFINLARMADLPGGLDILLMLFSLLIIF